MSATRSLVALILVVLGVHTTLADDSKLEADARKALADGDTTALTRLADDYRQLTPDARRALSVRIREDSVEFAFRGEFPGDQYLPDSQEYLVGPPGKDYETLLVIGPDEATRLDGLRPVFAGREVKGRGKPGRPAWFGWTANRRTQSSTPICWCG